LPSTKSATREARLNVIRNIRGKPVRSQVKTQITGAEKLVFAGEGDKAKEAVVAAISALDKAAGKGFIHPNNAARRKARLMKKLNQASTAAAAKPKAKEKEAK